MRGGIHMYNSERQNEGNYVVLYRRDIKTEKQKGYGEKMLFDYAKNFGYLTVASDFALQNLPAILMKTGGISEEDKLRVKSTEKPYVVVAKFYGKYSSCCMGETESMKTFDAVRCSEQNLEKTIEELAGESSFGSAFAGIELKLI